MKKKITGNFATIVKSIFLPLVASIILLSSFTPAPANANDSTGTKTTIADIKYLGIKNDEQAVFQVEFSNENHESFSLTIKDAYGVTLYSESFKDAMFSKKFSFNKEEFGNSSLTFTLKTKDTNDQQTFHLNTKSIETTVVTKL